MIAREYNIAAAMQLGTRFRNFVKNTKAVTKTRNLETWGAQLCIESSSTNRSKTVRFSLCRSALAACGSRLQIERGRNLFGSCTGAQDPGRYLVHILVPDGNSLTPDEPRGAVSRFPSVPQSSFSSLGARSSGDCVAYALR